MLFSLRENRKTRYARENSDIITTDWPMWLGCDLYNRTVSVVELSNVVVVKSTYLHVEFLSGAPFRQPQWPTTMPPKKPATAVPPRTVAACHPAQKSLLRRWGFPWNSTTTTHPSMDDVPGDWVRAIGPTYLHACLSCHAHCPYAPCASRVWTTPLSARAVFAGAQLPDRLGPHVQNPSGAHIIYAYVLAHYSCVLYTDCICTLSIPPTFPWQARASRCCSRWDADADANADVDANVDAVSPPPKTEKPPPPPQLSPPPGHRRATPSSSSAASPPPSSPPHHHLKPPTAATATFSRRHRCRHRCQHRCHHR